MTKLINKLEDLITIEHQKIRNVLFDLRDEDKNCIVVLSDLVRAYKNMKKAERESRKERMSAYFGYECISNIKLSQEYYKVIQDFIKYKPMVLTNGEFNRKMVDFMAIFDKKYYYLEGKSLEPREMLKFTKELRRKYTIEENDEKLKKVNEMRSKLLLENDFYIKSNRGY